MLTWVTRFAALADIRARHGEKFTRAGTCAGRGVVLVRVPHLPRPRRWKLSRYWTRFIQSPRGHHTVAHKTSEGLNSVAHFFGLQSCRRLQAGAHSNR